MCKMKDKESQTVEDLLQKHFAKADAYRFNSKAFWRENERVRKQ